MTLILDNLVLKESDFLMISNLVHEHCGINLHAGKKELVRARLAKRLREGDFRTFPEYIKYALEDSTGAEFSILIDSLSTNLTSFFREPKHFDFLQSSLLPALFHKKKKMRNFKLRGWSAGCSTGEEPYSLAITLLDAIARGERWNVKLLATDISQRVLKIAMRGIYDKQRVASVPSLQKQRYLVHRVRKDDSVFEVAPAVRNVVAFRYLNLIQTWPFHGPIDFIFCRNVMIYFDKDTQQNLVNRFWDVLDSGGILFTGHSESLTGIEHQFKYIQPTIYRKP